MKPWHWLVDTVAERFTKRTLVRLTILLFVVLLVSQLVLFWWIGTVGVSLRETAYNEDDRTVVIDRADLRKFERQYSADHEVGWCLYGSLNRTHIRIDDVVRADPLSTGKERVAFTCKSETIAQVTAMRNPRLVGTVHTHLDRNRSRPSRVDIMTWGRLSPVMRVMGVYTKRDGVEFFTERSLTHPLRKRAV